MSKHRPKIGSEEEYLNILLDSKDKQENRFAYQPLYTVKKKSKKTKSKRL